MNSKCPSCGYVYKKGDVFCIKCGNKLSPAAVSSCAKKTVTDNPLSVMSGIGELMESVSKLISNSKDYEEKYLNSQGIDIEKYRERQKAISLSPEEMKGKSFSEINSLQIDKELRQTIEDCKQMKKTLAIEFFQTVKPKFQTQFPDREKMIERLNNYVVLRGKDIMSVANMMNIGNKIATDNLSKDNSSFFTTFSTIEDIINYSHMNNPPDAWEIPVLTFKNAYFEAVSLIDEYCECAEREQKYVSFHLKNKNITAQCLKN